jgi:hypothetical protein
LNLKKSLANEYQYDRQTYTKKKEPFIREVFKCAGINLINITFFLRPMRTWDK